MPETTTDNAAPSTVDADLEKWKAEVSSSSFPAKSDAEYKQEAADADAIASRPQDTISPPSTHTGALGAPAADSPEAQPPAHPHPQAETFDADFAEVDHHEAQGENAGETKYLGVATLTVTHPTGIVDYALTREQADTINQSRVHARAHLEMHKAAANGSAIHVGNMVSEGQVFPMIIVAVWSGTCVNGQVFLDGNDTLWATSVSQDLAPAEFPPSPGSYRWPQQS